MWRSMTTSGFRRTFVVAFVLCFLAMSVWSFATPLFAGPDEPTHIQKAVAMVRGQILGELLPQAGEAPSASPYAAVTIPKFYAVDRKIQLVCFHDEPTVSAKCAASPGSLAARHFPPRGVRCPYGIYPPCSNYVTVIYNARYPPLYYAIVGLPSLLGSGNWAIYLMRLLSGVLSSIFLALGVSSALLWSKNRLVALGIMIAATPMVFYLGAVVNPSGLEIASALAFWSAGVVLVKEHLEDPPLGLLVALFSSACVFELVRGLSPFWLALSVLALLGVSNYSALLRFVSRRRVRIGMAVAAFFGVLAVAWIIGEHALDVASPIASNHVPLSVSYLTILEKSFAHNDYYLPDMIGVFGSFDTFAPLVTYVVWYGLIGLITIGALAFAKRRDAVVLGAVVIAILFVPVLISSSQAHAYGYTWSGRDTLPFAVGLPIVAASLLGEHLRGRGRGRLVGVVAFLAGAAQFAAFYEALRRYSVGTKGPDFAFLIHPSWQPPIGVVGALLAELAILVASYVLFVRASQRRDAAPIDVDVKGNGLVGDGGVEVSSTRGH